MKQGDPEALAAQESALPFAHQQVSTPKDNREASGFQQFTNSEQL